jgi:hypothetical protein
MVHDHVLLYPVMLLEDVEHGMGTAHELPGKALGGKYVYTTRFLGIKCRTGYVSSEREAGIRI